jgi:hypothetical protein
MLLERALREAEDNSEPGRHIALVTLDGACEYAVRLAAHHRGLALKPDTSIHDAIGKVRQALGNKWRQTAVRGVVELRAARNQAQHMGLLPDAELTAGWTVDAKAFVHDLVEAAFDVSLDEVMLADAIRDEELRGLLSEAERQLNFGEFRSAFRYADQALLNARVLWRSQRDGKYETTRDILRPPGFSSLPAAPGDPLDQLEVQVFATDMSRYAQLLTTRRHLQIGGPEPDAAEARSALMFAFDWILRWEVFVAGYPADRYADFWRGIRSPQLDDGGPPRIAWHIKSYPVERGGIYEPQYEMLLQLANVPAEEDRNWGVDFPAALASAKDELESDVPVEFYGIDPTGVLRVRVPANADAGEVVGVLTRAVKIATDLHNRRDQTMGLARSEAVDLRVAFEAVVCEDATNDFVFGDVEVQPELTPTGVRFIVELSLPAATVAEREKAAAIFRNQGEELAATSQQAGKVVFEAFTLQGDALERLRTAIKDSEAEILLRREIAAKQEREIQAFSQHIEQLLGAVPATTFEPAQDAEESR